VSWDVKDDGRATEKGTVSWLLRRYVAGCTDVTEKAREQYAWAVTHIEAGLGAISLARLDRDDVAAWIEGLAAGGQLGRRSIQACRNVLRAALAEAVDEGLITRSPAARVGLPRVVAKPVIEKAAVVWDESQVDRFLEVAGSHRWAVAFRLGVLFGLRRSEVLALRWDDVDQAAKTLRIDESLVALNNGAAWGRRQERTISTSHPDGRRDTAGTVEATRRPGCRPPRRGAGLGRH
jgi:integrase